jgi:outer membrane biosynthesis protein TonB
VWLYAVAFGLLVVSAWFQLKGNLPPRLTFVWTSIGLSVTAAVVALVSVLVPGPARSEPTSSQPPAAKAEPTAAAEPEKLDEPAEPEKLDQPAGPAEPEKVNEPAEPEPEPSAPKDPSGDGEETPSAS